MHSAASRTEAESDRKSVWSPWMERHGWLHAENHGRSLPLGRKFLTAFVVLLLTGIFTGLAIGLIVFASMVIGAGLGLALGVSTGTALVAHRASHRSQDCQTG